MRLPLFFLTLITACGAKVVPDSPDASPPITGGPQDGSVDMVAPFDAGEDAEVEGGFCEGCNPADADPGRYCIIHLSGDAGGYCDGERMSGTVVSTSCAEGVPQLLAGCTTSDAGAPSCVACGAGSTVCLQYSPYENSVTAVACAGP